jgi:hypothetical protein
MLEAGFPLHHVQQMLGHGNVQTTDTYLNVTKLGLKESMRRVDDLRRACKIVANGPPHEPAMICNKESDVAAKQLLN